MRQASKQPPKEHAEQATLVNWWRTAGYRQHRTTLYPAQLWAIPNGGTSNAIMGRQLNAEGRLAGVADLFLQVPIAPYHGLFIEMKRTHGGQQSEAQRNFEALAWLTGYAYALCRGFEAAQQAISAYLSGQLQPPAHARNITVVGG